MSSKSVRQTPTLLLGFLFAGGLINYMDRAVIGLLGPAMRSDLGLTAGEFGIVMGAFSIGYTIFTLVGGWATDRFGAPRVLLATMLVWSLFAGLTGVVSSLAALIVVRFLFGIGEAPWLSAFNKVLVDRVPRERFSTFHSLCSSGQPLGGAIAGPLMGLVAAAYGWRAGFWAVGLIGFLWAALWVLLMIRRRDASPVATPSPSARREAPPAASRGEVMRNLTIWVCIFAMAGATYLMVFFFSWFPSYLSASFQLNERQLGLVSALPWLVGVAAYAGGGLLSDWLAVRLGSLTRARRLLIVTCLSCSGVLTMLVPFSHSLTGALVLMSAGMGLMYLTGSMYFAIGLGAAPASLVGFVSGIFLFCSNLSATVSPILSGYLIQWTGKYDASFVVAGSIAILAALAALVAIRPRPDADAASQPGSSAAPVSPKLEGSLS